jgi:outer membrane protein assembly factor BamD
MVQCVVLGAIIFLFSGCAQKSAKLQKSVTPPDQTLFDTGANYLNRGQYIQARLAFNTMLSTYPDSDLAAEAYFAMGDTFYEEGGTQNLLQAEDRYTSFLTFFPGHEKAADAQMKIIALNSKLILSPDRDQQYSYRALREIERFLQRHPESDYAPFFEQRRIEVINHIARGDLGVGDFYEKRGNYLGAIGRFREILNEYDEYSERDGVLYRLAGIMEKAQDFKEAGNLYAEIAEGYPFSEYYEKARARLIALNMEIPPVDTQLASLNESKLVKPSEGFNPMKAFVDLGKALGFVGPPDLYAEAVQTLEEERMTELAKAKAREQEMPMDGDFQILEEIRQSISESARIEEQTGSTGVGQEDADREDAPGRYQRRTQ